MAKKVTVDEVDGVVTLSDVKVDKTTNVNDVFFVSEEDIMPVVSMWITVETNPVTKVLNLPTGCIVHTDAGASFVTNVRYRTESGRFDRIM